MGLTKIEKSEITKAVKYLNKFQPKYALPILKSLFKKYPKDPKVGINFGLCKLRLEEYDELCRSADAGSIRPGTITGMDRQRLIAVALATRCSSG